MIYYKCNKLMKIIASFIPGIIVVLLISINNLTNIQVWKSIEEFFIIILGFNGEYNSNIAVLSFLVATIGWYIFSFLLNRRMPLKE